MSSDSKAFARTGPYGGPPLHRRYGRQAKDLDFVPGLGQIHPARGGGGRSAHGDTRRAAARWGGKPRSEGFELCRLSSSLTDFHDDEEIDRVHYREIEGLIRHATGAAQVSVFDHIRRSSGNGRPGARVPVFAVHNDTPHGPPFSGFATFFRTGPEALLKRRFSLINAWHSIRGPVESFPLAVCDATEHRPQDLVAAELVYEGGNGEAFTRAQTPGRVGEIFNLAHNPVHRWFYFPRMERDEILLFKCFDSALDGRARFSAHTAFEDPNHGPDSAPRESIELRALAMFG